MIKVCEQVLFVLNANIIAGSLHGKPFQRVSIFWSVQRLRTENIYDNDAKTMF